MRSWIVTVVGLAALLALGLLPARAAQAEEKARLVFARGAGATDCPPEIELRLWVIARLGYDPFSPQASRVLLARVEQRGAKLVGTVELVDKEGMSSGRRELSAPKQRCDELSRAMALTISLTIDAERAKATRAQAGAPRGSTGYVPSEDEADQVDPDEAEPVPSAYRAREVRLFTGGALAGAVRLLPHFALGATGYVGMGWRTFSLQLEARFMRSFSSDLSPHGSIYGETIDTGLTGCRSFGPTGLCLVTQLGIERIRSGGLPYAHSVTAIHGAAGPRFSLYFPQPQSRLSVFFGVEGLLNLSLNHARMMSRDVWKSPLFSGTLLVGAETDFL